MQEKVALRFRINHGGSQFPQLTLKKIDCFLQPARNKQPFLSGSWALSVLICSKFRLIERDGFSLVFHQDRAMKGSLAFPHLTPHCTGLGNLGINDGPCWCPWGRRWVLWLQGERQGKSTKSRGWSNLVLVVLEQHYSNPPIFGYLQKSWGLSAGGATQCCGMSRVPNFPKNIFWLKNQRSPMWIAASQAGESAWISLDINVALVLSGDIANLPLSPHHACSHWPQQQHLLK